MKKILLSLSILFGAVFGPGNSLRAQFIGEVRVENVRLSVTATDSLRLEMEIAVADRAMNPCQSWTIVPELSTPDKEHVQLFPHVLINGNHKRKISRRRAYLTQQYWQLPQPYQSVDAKRDQQTRIDYQADVPYEEWMGDASLFLQQVLTSCADKRQLFTVRCESEVAYPKLEPYDPQVAVAYCEPVPEQKDRKVRGQAFLDFQIGRSAILPTFHNNAAELEKIGAVFAQLRSMADARITDIYIEGYASPEGKYETNERLSQARAEALKQYLLKTFGMPEVVFHVSSTPEDWAGLAALVEQSTLPEKQRVLDIAASDDRPDRKEQRLRSLPATWRVLSTTIFPQLRHVDYQVDFRIPSYNLQESLALIDTAPEKLSQPELYRAAMSFPDGSEQRRHIFEVCLKCYPDSSEANTNAGAARLGSGDPEGAQRCFEQAAGGLRPEALSGELCNNLGALYVKQNRLAEAAPLLEAAARNGIPQARINISEAEKKAADNLRLEHYGQ